MGSLVRIGPDVLKRSAFSVPEIDLRLLAERVAQDLGLERRGVARLVPSLR